MGKQFGNLAKVSGIVRYSLSPFEQRAFAGAVSRGLPNIWRRFTESVFKVVPPFVALYLIVDYGETKNKELARKEATQNDN
ncbi:hypothetical protein SNE40_020987 [Patella caerulea]|uniref:Cytochrome b-c1 complex subunit 8 n=1 Tax=Patella caerulea TaxID=87958 RepID=A0AAN8GCY9_PATCE